MQVRARLVHQAIIDRHAAADQAIDGVAELHHLAAVHATLVAVVQVAPRDGDAPAVVDLQIDRLAAVTVSR